MATLILAAAGLVAGCGDPVPPTSAQLLREGRQAYEQGQADEAIERTDRFLAMHGGTQEAAEAYYLRGLARGQLGQLELAEQDFLAAAERTRRPDLAGRARLALGELAEQRGDLPAAEEQYRAALDALPHDQPPADEALYRLADLLQRTGRWEEADQRYDRLGFLFTGTDRVDLARQRVRARAWTIHTGVFLGLPHAEQEARRLREAGLPARIEPQGAGAVRFAVQAGAYSTYTDAEQALPGVQAVSPDARIALSRAAPEAPDQP